MIIPHTKEGEIPTQSSSFPTLFEEADFCDHPPSSTLLHPARTSIVFPIPPNVICSQTLSRFPKYIYGLLSSEGRVTYILLCV